MSSKSAFRFAVNKPQQVKSFLDRLHVGITSLENSRSAHLKSLSTQRWIMLHWDSGLLKPLLAWIVWLYLGTVFYAHVDFCRINESPCSAPNYYKGFYYSINVGYSIGWGVFHDLNDGSKFFSTVYLLLGATAIAEF